MRKREERVTPHWSTLNRCSCGILQIFADYLLRAIGLNCIPVTPFEASVKGKNPLSSTVTLLFSVIFCRYELERDVITDRCICCHGLGRTPLEMNSFSSWEIKQLRRKGKRQINAWPTHLFGETGILAEAVNWEIIYALIISTACLKTQHSTCTEASRV